MPVSSREHARRAQCRYNLLFIGLALSNYASDYGRLPPAYTVDADGRPLHSWRTLILPYLDNQPLYDKIDLSMPWDDPVNQVARETIIPCYACPLAANFERSIGSQHGYSSYLAVVSDGSCFQPIESHAFSEITDRPDQTLLVVEAPPEASVPWMSPEDADKPLILSLASQIDSTHKEGVPALFADGKVRFVPSSNPTSRWAAMLTINGEEELD